MHLSGGGGGGGGGEGEATAERPKYAPPAGAEGREGNAPRRLGLIAAGAQVGKLA